jgi:uncharacterized protein (DUF697 family)
MTRKPLPRAIRQTDGDLKDIVAERKDDRRRRPQPEGTAASDPAAADAQPQAPSAPAPAPGAEVPAAAGAPPAEADAERRHAMARKIVERYKMYAAMGGLLPLPIVSVAGVTAINLKMVKALSDLYRVPFERDRNRSIIVGLMGGAVPAGFATATASTLVFIIPGSAFVGLAVSSVTAAACTRGIGMVFIDHFESTSRRAGNGS